MVYIVSRGTHYLGIFFFLPETSACVSNLVYVGILVILYKWEFGSFRAMIVIITGGLSEWNIYMLHDGY